MCALDEWRKISLLGKVKIFSQQTHTELLLLLLNIVSFVSVYGVCMCVSVVEDVSHLIPF
jgi:flagellar biosynthesis protein FlhB